MRRLLFALAALLVLGGDQISKWWVSHHYPYDVPVPVWAPYVYLYHTTNDGVAWSLFRGHTWLFSLIAAVFSIGILLFARKAVGRSAALAVALGLLLGGSLGNLVDRVRLHQVVDFIQVNIGHWYQWPTFNVADSAITCGMILLALYLWLQESGGTAQDLPREPGNSEQPPSQETHLFLEACAGEAAPVSAGS